MAKHIVVGSIVTLIPSEGEATDYSYAVNDMNTVSVSEQGILTALNPGQVVVKITRLSDGATVERIIYNIVTEEELVALDNPPGFSLRPLFLLRVDNVTIVKRFNEELTEDSHGFTVNWQYIPIGDGTDDWATELEFQIEIRQGPTSTSPLITPPNLKVTLPRSEEDAYSLLFEGAIPTGDYSAYVGLSSWRDPITEVYEQPITQSLTASDIAVGVGIANPLLNDIDSITSHDDLFLASLSNIDETFLRTQEVSTVLLTHSPAFPSEQQYATRLFKLQSSNNTTNGVDGTWSDIQTFSLSTWIDVSPTTDDTYYVGKLLTTDNPQTCYAEVTAQQNIEYYR